MITFGGACYVDIMVETTDGGRMGFEARKRTGDPSNTATTRCWRTLRSAFLGTIAYRRTAVGFQANRTWLPKLTKCSDGIDNNSDGSVDLEYRQCLGAEQDSEMNWNR